jgi:chromosome segregation ATPase
MRRRAVLLSLTLALLLPGQSSKVSLQAERDRLESTIQQLQELKAKVSVFEAQLDELLRALSEQRGALQQKPTEYNALEHVAPAAADAPDKPKPAAQRCAAITAKGERCMRAAMPGGRYCKQHQMVGKK